MAEGSAGRGLAARSVPCRAAPRRREEPGRRALGAGKGLCPGPGGGSGRSAGPARGRTGQSPLPPLALSLPSRGSGRPGTRHGRNVVAGGRGAAGPVVRGTGVPRRSARAEAGRSGAGGVPVRGPSAAGGGLPPRPGQPGARHRVSVINTVDTSHEDMIHDAQMDYYGTRLATCSSDRSVKIFDVRNGGQILIADLRGHEGPVWQVAWAHPMYGNILASCSYDRKVIIWKEENGTWEKTYEYTGHDSSVNSVCWAPHDYGLILACGSSDGAISLLSYTGDGQWEVKKISNAHTIGCNAVSWAPAVVPGSLIEQPSGQKPNYIKRFASGGCDNLVKIWKEEEGQWKEEQKLEAHSDWVRDVAWAPSIGLPTSTIASCSQDGRVFIWTCDDASGNSWSPKLLHKFNDVVWHVSWSITANILAVSGGDNKVTLWKESVDGLWACISDVNKGQGGVSAVTEGQQNEQ
ncbi:protein SEC13 homolog [Pyrgilauda ruficollis]|nr:protein SEC13 homolog [Pyrgilauda ruficollis]